MRHMRHCLILGCLQIMTPAFGATITLDFEGTAAPDGAGAEILDFYNGGTNSVGASGIDYGVSFGQNALAILDRDAGGVGNFANEPSPSTAMFFLSGNPVLNVPLGFSDGFSFYYTSSEPATVRIYDGPDRTGNVIGIIDLQAQSGANGCAGDPTGNFCHWTATGVTFEGLARSVDFSGTVNQTAFDNVTLGSATPTAPVPEAGTGAMWVAGLAAMGGWLLRRRRQAGT